MDSEFPYRRVIRHIIMRIAHICTRFNRLSETFVYDLIAGLERVGTENHVLTSKRVNVMERPFPRVRVVPVPLWCMAAFVIRKYCLNIYRFPLPWQATRKALAAISPDVILAHFGSAGAAIAPVAFEMRIPLVVVFHAFDLFTRPFGPATYKELWASGAKAVTVCEHSKRRLLELGCPAKGVQTIHCGVDISRFSPAEDWPTREKGLRLVAIGRFVEKKGFDDLILAVGTLRSRRAQPIRLDIWGDGPLKGRLECLAQRLGLSTTVFFKGIVASRDVPRLLRQYDAFVSPSRTARNGDSEGIPVTILEAQAAGLPVVATRHAGIPEGIPRENHYLLAREGDARDLADKLELLCAQRTRWREIGLCGREWVLKNFTLEGELAEYLQLFAQITSSSTPLASPTIGGGT